MGWWSTLLNWANAPESAPAQNPQPGPRWARPLSFSVDVPPEMTGMVGSGALVPRVSRDEALSVPAVKRVRDLIAGTLGTLPLCELDISNTEVSNELLEQPEEDMARSVTMARTVEDMLFEGRAWWRVTEFTPQGWPAKVVRLEPRSVTVREEGRVYVSSATGNAQGQAWRFVPDAELIRIDSPNDPLLVVGARAIRDCMALARAVTRNVEDPAPMGYFSPAGEVDPGDQADVDEILDNWEDAVARRAWPYLNGALKANVIAWNPEQMQLAQARDAAILEVARLGGVDPEELGVSTTSRTYANSEQRRLDLLDFTLLAYVTAIEDRLSMRDVTVPGHRVWAEYQGFLRSDTESRMRTYKAGMEVGVHDAERIARLERIPVARVRKALDAAKPAPAPAGGGADARALVEAVQKVYLGVGKVLSVDEARQMLNRMGAGLPIPAPPLEPSPAPVIPPQQEAPVQQTFEPARAANFTADEPAVTIGFVIPPQDAEFKADATTRTVSGMVIPWNSAAHSRGHTWMFAPGSLHWANESRVKLDRDHEYGSELGRAVTLTNGAGGLAGSFKVARGAEGDRILGLAEDGVYDGFSASVSFDAEADGWTAHPDDPNIRLVQSATLRKVAITAMPAFDDARVDSVAATRRDTPMTAPAAPAAPAPAPAGAPQSAAPPDGGSGAPALDLAAFTAGITTAVSAAVGEAFKNLPQPQGMPERQVVPAGRVQVTREEPVYLMNGSGHSLVRDAWKSRTEGDFEARARLDKFTKMTGDAAREAIHPEFAAQFAVTTGNASQVIPPGYRPDLYVTQLMKGRPLVNSVSRGTLTDATPFNIPSFVSATGATADHVEGVNPSQGSLQLGVVTVAPTAVSGTFQLTREIVDSSNPAVDAIAMTAMQESYSQQTEAKVYTELNGVNGQGGVITAGFVPSGAQVSTTLGAPAGIAEGGDELLAGVRGAMALYPFRRFGLMDRAHISQEATQSFASAKDTTGRPLLPFVGAFNSVGTGNTQTQGYFIDGLTFQPTWAMTGNAAGDADVLMFNAMDAWAWESALLMFRFEERNGPAFIDLSLFGYFATRILRPVGLAAVRHTVA